MKRHTIFSDIWSRHGLDKGKKLLCCLATLLLLFLFNCEKAAVHHTLSYTAGENGTIKGDQTQTVSHGSTGSMVMAVADDGYHFASWSDGVTTPDRTDANVIADLAVTATFAINQYSLKYTADEHGAIEGAYLQTVNYGADGTPVTAVPAAHYHFVSWSDGVTTPDRTDTTVTADLTVTATFAIDQYTLNYTAGEKGSIDGAAVQIIDYGSDAEAVKAIPAVGYHFVSWSDGVTTPERIDRKVTEDITVTATFAINQYALTYAAGKNGTITGPSRQTVTHGDDGSQVTAVPAEHYHFTGWSDGVATANRIDRQVNEDIQVTANFAIDQYTVTYMAEEHGSIDGASPQKVNHGGSGRPITAVPAEGYHFVNWSDGVDTARRIDSEVTADLAVTASFAINRYTLTYAAEENGTIEGTTPQTVAHGGDGSAVTAVARKGYHFVNWSDGLTSAQRVDSKVTSDLTVSAVFAVNTYSIGGRVAGLVDGTQVVLQNNGGDDLVINANGDFTFATELLNTASYDVRVLTQPTDPNQTCRVTGGIGTVSEEDVTDIEVACILNTYTIGGTVTGLPAGFQVVLRNNDTDDLVLSANGGFTFATPLDDHSEYEVTVYKQPERPNWKCTAKNAVDALRGKDVTDVIIDCYPEAVLLATAGIRKVNLKWNSQDFIEATSNQVTFNLCHAQEEIPHDGFKDCRNLKEGVLETALNSPHTASPLTNDIPYWFQLEVHAASGRRTLSKVVKALPFGGLNDTGIDWCADDTKNHTVEGTKGEKTTSCRGLAPNYPGQDGLHGRDALARARQLDKKGSGSAGFDFTKVCMTGEIAGEGNCPPNPSLGTGPKNWACTRDNVTGLLWEEKTTSGLHGMDNTYSWYNPDETKNGGAPGVQNGGRCQESDCDTQAFVQAVNSTRFCGVSDWRLPTRMELLSILDNSRYQPAIDTRYFPNTPAEYNWSSSPYNEDKDSAWEVHFKYGEADTNKKNERNHVRLVRGRTVTFGLDNP
jgi:MOSC domain-containing protein YiiM